jgi:hypothetical protein
MFGLGQRLKMERHRMKFWIGFVALILAVPGLARSYQLVLHPPPGGRLLKGYGGLQASDQWTATALVRVITPGNDVDRRGTVRVLVMNLGASPFTFGPKQVTLRLGDGTILAPTPLAEFEKGRILIERESSRAAITDRANRNSFSALARAANSGMTASTPGVSAPSGGQPTNADGHDLRADLLMLPGGRTLDAIYQLLIPQAVAPQQAWGGYYVFDVPKHVQSRRADQPLTIIVRTGREHHRFPAMLRWK